MDSEETLPETEVVEDPSIMLTRKINSMTRQNHRVKSKDTKEEKLKKQKVGEGRASGRGGGRAGRGRGGGRGPGRGALPTM